MIYYCEKDDLGISDTEFLRLCDDNNSGTWDQDCQDKFDRLRKAATDIINSYAVKKYKVPFSQVPGTILECCAIITKYKLYGTRSAVSKQLRQDYEDQVDFLKKLSEGKVGILEIDSQNEDQENVVKPKARIFSTRNRSDRKFYNGLPGY
jgi:phage gp36-like protein